MAARSEDFEAVEEGILEYGVARYRASFKARRDALRDREKRVLIGARLDRETAGRVREAAEASGRSLYRFVADALQEEVERTTGF